MARGEGNEKKFHLVNWESVQRPKSQGGLAIKDPQLMNIALGAKTLWHLISNPKEWWKTTFIRKYFMRDSIKRVEACNWE